MKSTKPERVRQWEEKREPGDTIEIPAVFADLCRWMLMGYQDDQPGTAEDVMALMDRQEQHLRSYAKAQGVLLQKLGAAEIALEAKLSAEEQE